MRQSDSAALKRLLHMHGTLAEGAEFFALSGLNQCPGESGQVTSIPILQGPDLLLQERECGEREFAVFFSP
jgi:hypothetical protein